MASRQSNRKPSFFWQAALILLPVMVLAAVGFVSLRQDRLLAQKEAEERAREIADDLVSKAWQELMTTNGEGHAFQVDGEGNLVFPPPVAAFPEPKPLKLADLNATQLRLWQTAQGAESEQEKGSSGMQAYRDFLDSNPPSEFAAMAEYSLGMLLVANGQPKEAAKSFLTVIANYPDAMGESGLPLAPLAELRWLELTEFGAFSPAATNRSTSGSFDLRGMRRDSIRTLSASAEITNATKIQPSFDSFCSNLVYHPSPLSPYLLQTALKEFVPGTDFSDKVHPNTNRVWLGLWREHEFSRGLYEGARRSLMSPPRLFWFREDGEPWLATRMEKLRISCESESQVNRRLAALLPAERGIPDYLGVEVEIAGRSLGGLASDLRPWKEVNYAGKGGGVRKQFLSDFPVSMIAANAPRPPLLASAIHSENGAELMRVNVFLTSPDQLFKRQTTRTFWFGSLIAVIFDLSDRNAGGFRD